MDKHEIRPFKNDQFLIYIERLGILLCSHLIHVKVKEENMKACRWFGFFLLGGAFGLYSAIGFCGENMEAQLARQASLHDLVQYAQLNNPSIRAAKEAWRAAIETYRTATGYPDPVLSVTYFPEPIETRLGPQDWNLSLSQMIPFPGKLSKAGAVALAGARIAKINLNKTTADIVVALRESYHELLYIQAAKQAAAENLKLLNHLRKVGETAYAEDRAALLDMVKAQSQLGQLRYDILLLEELEQTEKTRLNSLMNRKPEAPIGVLDKEVLQPLAYGLSELYQMAEKNREEIRIAELMIQKAKAGTDLARYRNLPDFKIGLWYGSIGDPEVTSPPPDAGRDALGIQIGVTLPLWSEKNRGHTERAQAEVRKAVAKKAVRINKTREEVHRLFFRLNNSRRLTELYHKELIPQAAAAMELAEVWFRGQESSFSDFVETQAVWYQFQLALTRAQADYGKALARLARLCGNDLIRRPDHSEKPEQKEAKQ